MGKINWNDILYFRKMLTPIVIQIIYWLASVIMILAGLILIGEKSIIPGLLLTILGPILVRIYCELVIVIFKIYEALTDKKTKE